MIVEQGPTLLAVGAAERLLIASSSHEPKGPGERLV